MAKNNKKNGCLVAVFAIIGFAFIGSCFGKSENKAEKVNKSLDSSVEVTDKSSGESENKVETTKLESETTNITTTEATTELTSTTTKATTELTSTTTTEIITEQTTTTTTEAITEQTTTVEITQPEVKSVHFILNTDTNCVHLKSTCNAAEQILPENYAEIDIPENEIIYYKNEYWACGICARKYTEQLPKFEDWQ